MLDRLDEVARGEVRVRVEVRRVEDRARGHAGGTQLAHRLLLRPLPCPLLDLVVQLLHMLEARLLGREARVCEHVRAVERGAERVPHARGDDHQVDVIVGSEGLARVDIRRRAGAIPLPMRGLLGAVAVVRDHRAHEVGGRLLHRQLDELPLSRAQLLHVGRRDRERHLHTRPAVADREARTHRRPVGLAGDGEGGGRGQRNHVVALEVRVRPAEAEALDAPVDEARVQLVQHVVVDVEPLDHAGAVVLDEHIEVGHEPQEQLAPFARLEIECDAAFVRVPRQEVRARIGAARHAAAGIPDPGTLQLHDIRAEPCQRLRAGGPGLVLRHVEDAHAVQRGHGATSFGRGASSCSGALLRAHLPGTEPSRAVEPVTGCDGRCGRRNARWSLQ